MTSLSLRKPAPLQVQNLTSSATVNGVLLNWTSVSDAVLYEIHSSTINDVKTATLVATSSANSYIVTTTPVGSYFWVRAVNFAGVAGAFSGNNPLYVDYTIGSNFKTLRLLVWAHNPNTTSRTYSVDYINMKVYWLAEDGTRSSVSSTFTSSITERSSPGSTAWTNPTNGRANDGSSATVTLTSVADSKSLVFICSDFSAIPDTAVIYQVEISGQVQCSAAGGALRATFFDGASEFANYTSYTFTGTAALFASFRTWIDPNSSYTTVSNSATSVQAPSSATTTATVYSTGWANPSNVTAPDSAFSTLAMPSSGQAANATYQPVLTVTFPSANIPAGATITHFGLAIYGSQVIDGSPGTLYFNNVEMKPSSVSGTTWNYFTPNQSTVGNLGLNYSIGSTSLTPAGKAVTPASFNTGTVCVKIQVLANNSSCTRKAQIDYVQLTVTYTEISTVYPWFPPASANGVGGEFLQISSYDVLQRAGAPLAQSSTSGVYAFYMGGSVVKSGNSSPTIPQMIYVDPADYPSVGALTKKMRISGHVATNNQTGPGVNLTFGLYPVSGVATSPASTIITYTLGTVVSGSTATISAPVPASVINAVSSDFDVPAAGYYVLGVSLSGSTASLCHVGATLQSHYS